MINIINIILFYFFFGIKYTLKDELNEFGAHPRKLMQDNIELTYLTDRAHLMLIYAFNRENDGTRYYSSLTEIISLIHQSYTFIGRSILTLVSAHNTPTMKWTDNIELEEELQLSQIPSMEELRSEEDVDMAGAISYSHQYIVDHRLGDVSRYFIIIFTETGAYDCMEAARNAPYPGDGYDRINFIDYGGDTECGYALVNCNTAFSCPAFHPYSGSRMDQVNHILNSPIDDIMVEEWNYRDAHMHSILERTNMVYVFDQTKGEERIPREVLNSYFDTLVGMYTIFKLGGQNTKIEVLVVTTQRIEIIQIGRYEYSIFGVPPDLDFVPITWGSGMNSGLVEAINMVDPQPHDDSVINRIVHLSIECPIVDGDSIQNTIEMASSRGINVVVHVVCPKGKFTYDVQTSYPRLIKSNYENVYMAGNYPLTCIAQMTAMLNQYAPGSTTTDVTGSTPTGVTS